MRVTYYCAMSCDEFIATEAGDVSWLDELDVDDSASSYEAFFASVDGLVMGRATYDFVFDYGSWPYGDLPTWVFTHRPLEPLAGANLRPVQSIDEFLLQTEAAKLQHIWLVGGGQLASSFLERDLLSHISITESPVALKTGIPLFAAHSLKSIKALSRSSIQKQGCKQIDIVLRD